MKMKPAINYRKNIVFIKFFLSLLCVSTLAVAILAVNMFYWLSGKSEEDFNSMNQMALSNIDVVVSNYIESSKRLALELYQNPIMKGLMFSSDREWGEKYRASRQIDSIMLANPYISSVYIFDNNGILLDKSKDFLTMLQKDTPTALSKEVRRLCLYFGRGRPTRAAKLILFPFYSMTGIPTIGASMVQ